MNRSERIRQYVLSNVNSRELTTSSVADDLNEKYGLVGDVMRDLRLRKIITAVRTEVGPNGSRPYYVYRNGKPPAPSFNRLLSSFSDDELIAEVQRRMSA